MIEPRSTHPSKTAVLPGDGCVSGLLLPPVAVLLVSGLLAIFMLGQANITAAARGDTATIDLAQVDQPAQPAQPILPAQPAGLSPVFTPEVDYWADSIIRWASNAGLDPNLAATVMQIESCGDPQATSRSGATSLFQVMPFHFVAGENAYDPETNAFRGMDYLRRSLEAATGDARLALAGYNGGIGVIAWAESDWPLETQRYAYWGSGIYTDASSGLTDSPRLQEWLNSNGLYLCMQAAERLGIAP
jgi:soluble lytic murein transglycosylase-like protein